jgi:mannose-6-phosphate isomerase-like protein (cupin superfamily)
MLFLSTDTENSAFSVIGPDGGQKVHALPYANGFYRIIVRGNETSERFTIIEGLVYINEGARTHYHMDEDESFFLVNGTLQFYVAGKQFCAHAGTTVFIPRNVTQSVRNVNSKPVHVQILFSPSGREHYLEEVSVINDNPPINATQATELALKYGQVNLPEVIWEDLDCFSRSSSTCIVKSTSFILVLAIVLLSIH